MIWISPYFTHIEVAFPPPIVNAFSGMRPAADNSLETSSALYSYPNLAISSAADLVARSAQIGDICAVQGQRSVIPCPCRVRPDI